MDSSAISGVFGGIGLFLLGMFLMTNGLRQAAGRALQKILERWTQTTLRGILAGFAITALVQASGAVTVATLGFVNAGLLRLRQAVTVVYGSNIGTTVTGWLVAGIGFHLDIKAFALPAIGFGMLLRLLANGRRIGAFGEALAGFGIFFLGIEILKTAFEGMGQSIQFQDLDPTGPGLLLLVGMGFIMTVLMQSSSAAMAIILTAAGGGVVPVEGAAAMVIGANIGTTSTAMLAVIGATANAKRLATAHVGFNVITGGVALLLLPWLLQLIEPLQSSASPPTLLAVFHTLFNVLGVILMWPLTNRLVEMLQRRFRSVEEDEARPQFLDRTLLKTPELAVKALANELNRVGEIARRMAKGAISAELAPGNRLTIDHTIIEQLSIATGTYITDIQRGHIPADLAETLPNALRITRSYNTVARVAERVANRNVEMPEIRDEALSAEIAGLSGDVVELIKLTDQAPESYDPQRAADQQRAIDLRFRGLNNKLLQACTKEAISAQDLVVLLEQLGNIRRLGKHIEKGARLLHQFYNYHPATVLEETDTMPPPVAGNE